MSTGEMVRVPNSEVWIDDSRVVAVARLADSKIGDAKAQVVAVNFQIRLMDGKSVNVQSPNRSELKAFLSELGVEWSG